MTDIVPFGWPSASSLTIPVTAISSRVEFQPPSTGSRLRRVRVVNSGVVNAFIEFGGSAIAATIPASASTSGSLILLAGTCEVFTASGTFMAAICSTTSTTVHVTPGEGT